MKHVVTRVFAAMVLTICLAATAHATRYPNATFPDTLGVFHIQHPLAVPHPVVPDTVFGVQGIITGFDPIATGFALYIQTSTAAWTGLDIFTGGTPNCDFALGDLVAIYGKVQEFQGESELEGLDNVQASRDIIVRKISSGSPVPAFHVDAVSVLKEVPHAAPAGADSVREKWEGMLVRVPGPLRVVRTSLTGGLVTFNSFLVVDNTVCPSGSIGPCDSMMVEGSTLTNVFPPSVGTILTGAQGIYNERTRGYRIQLRNADDLDGPLPPNIVDAYPIGLNQYQVVMDRQTTTASLEDEINYSTGSLRTCLSAVAVSGTVVNVTFDATGAPAVGANESITVSGLVAVESGTVQVDPQSRNFTNGITTIMDIQAPSPDSLALAGAACKDVTKYSGNNNGLNSRVSFRGVATFMVGSAGNLQDPAGGLRSGLQIFAPKCPLVPGRQYLISGQLTEFGSGANLRETETQGTAFIQDEGVGAAVNPVVQTIPVLKDNTCDAAQSILNGEDYEGMLVRVNYGKVIRERVAGQSFVIRDPGGALGDTILIDSTGTQNFDPNLNDVVSVTGVLRFAAVTGLSAAQFRILPRDNGDILFHGNNVGVPENGANLVSFSIAPNPGRSQRVSFTLPRADLVELGVYDLQGRKLSVLANGLMGAGAYSREWDGVDQNGKQAGAGVYFYRLKVGSQTYNLRAVRID